LTWVVDVQMYLVVKGNEDAVR